MAHILSFINTPDFLEFIKTYGYIGIYVWFITIDQITVIPEEITLLIIGYGVANGIFNPFFAGGAALTAFLTIDIAYYFLARAGSGFVTKHFNVESGFIARYQVKMKEHMTLTLLLLNFIPRIRLWAPILVGSMRLPFKKFLAINTLGVAIVVTVYMTLGIFFHTSLETLIANVQYIQHIIFFSTVIVIGIVLFFFVRKIYRDSK